MKRFSTKKKMAAVVMIVLAHASLASANTFVNGGFEQGTLNGWTGGGGFWYGSPSLPANPSVYSGGPSNNVIMSQGTDPITNQSTVYNGRHSVRVNDSYNDWSVSTLRQSVQNYSDKHIYFEWNAVLQESHDTYDSDYFSLTLHDDTTNTDILSRSYSSASAPGIFTLFPQWYSNWYGSGWQVEDIDIEALGAQGHDFTLTVLASDCPYGGHAGYTYVDGFAPEVVDPGPGDPVPEPSTALLLGVGLAGAALGAAKRRKG